MFQAKCDVLFRGSYSANRVEAKPKAPVKLHMITLNIGFWC